jgi:hypothetical protein
VFLDLYVAAHKSAPKRIVLDLDATDDPLHAYQEGRFYHGFYRCYCYLPLYIFDGRHLLVAKPVANAHSAPLAARRHSLAVSRGDSGAALVSLEKRGPWPTWIQEQGLSGPRPNVHTSRHCGAGNTELDSRNGRRRKRCESG